jgi:hypothetical protein
MIMTTAGKNKNKKIIIIPCKVSRVKYSYEKIEDNDSSKDKRQHIKQMVHLQLIIRRYFFM